MSSHPCAVVVGSLHYDIVVDAHHRPAAGETVTGTAWRPVFGGKGGNQAAAVVAAGIPCRMVSAVGDDGFGIFLRDRLRASPIGITSFHWELEFNDVFARANPENGRPVPPGDPQGRLIPFKRGTLPAVFRRGDGAGGGRFTDASF